MVQLDYNHITYNLCIKNHSFEILGQDKFGYFLKCKVCSTLGRMFTKPEDYSVPTDVNFIDSRYTDFECNEMIFKNIIE